MTKNLNYISYGLRSFTRSFHSNIIKFSENKLNAVPADRTRNIGIIAHIDAGKTTTTERMLYYSGKTSRIGNVDEGDTVTDFLPSERQRGITIQLAAITIPWNNKKINIIDTPGHADFTFEVTRALRVLDGAVTILDGVAGVEAQSEKVWKQATTLGIPKIAYVNKMDRAGAGFSRTVKEIVEKLKTRVVLCNIPYFEKVDNDPVFKGVIDVLQCKILMWDSSKDSSGKAVSVVDINELKDTKPEIYEMVHKARESMVETLGEYDEELIDAFFENNEDYLNIPANILTKSIKKATIGNYVTPVLCGSSFKNIGVQPLMDAIVNYLPSPLEINEPEIVVSSSKLLNTKRKQKLKSLNRENVTLEMDLKKGLIVNKNPNLTLALAFKVMTHKTKGVMTFFRVYSGKLASNTNVVNTRTGKVFNIKKLLLIHGDEPEFVPYISSGNIGVISGSENEIITGDTLVSHGPTNKQFSSLESSLKLLPIEIPPPLFNSSIEPLTAGDQRYMDSCIESLIREDPSLKVSVDEDLGQTILSGMGELHLEIIRDRLVKDMKANARLRDVAVSYKESISKPNSKTINFSNEDKSLSIDIEMDSFEGNASEQQAAEEDGAVLFEQENNIIVFSTNATPEYMYKAIEENRWKSESSLEELQDTLIQGLATSLQVGGPILGLPLHSVILRVNAWNYPIEDKTALPSSLLDISRRVVAKYIDELTPNAFTILEPIMNTKVFVDSDSLGEVVHDLNQRCQATILSIDDETSENMDELSWAREESEKIYLPPDYTLSKSNSISELRNKKVILAETPLREMIGYLSKLRSITQGRGVFDMTYLGMRRSNKSKMTAITNDLHGI